MSVNTCILEYFHSHARTRWSVTWRRLLQGTLVHSRGEMHTHKDNHESAHTPEEIETRTQMQQHTPLSTQRPLVREMCSHAFFVCSTTAKDIKRCYRFN